MESGQSGGDKTLIGLSLCSSWLLNTVILMLRTGLGLVVNMVGDVVGKVLKLYNSTSQSCFDACLEDKLTNRLDLPTR